MKKTKLFTTALALTCVLTLGATSAYLADVSKVFTNEFDREWVYDQMEEPSGQEYNIIPGTQETKDPVVKVDTSVPAYAYVIVTDKTNGAVQYAIDPAWTELTGDQIPASFQWDGNKDEFGEGATSMETRSLGENQKIYYMEVPAGDDVDDNWDQQFPVLLDNIVSYSPDLTNEDLKAIEGEITLSFESYAIQKAPFNDPTAALTPQLAAAKAAAKAALLENLNSYAPEGDNEYGNDAQNAAYADAIAAIDSATTLDAVDNAKTAGITAIENAATPSPLAELNEKLKERGKTFEITELAGYMNWDDAKEYAAENGGRLGTIDELRSICFADREMLSRPIFSEMTGNSTDAWSSGEYDSANANGVDFYGGVVIVNSPKTKTKFVVVVRDLA